MSGLCDAHTHFSWNDARASIISARHRPRPHRLRGEGWRARTSTWATRCASVHRRPRCASTFRDPRRDKRRHDTGSAPSRLLHEFSTPEGTLLPGASIVVSGPGESARARAKVIELGVDVIRSSVRARRYRHLARRNDTYVTEEELAAVVEVAHARGRKVSVPRAAPSRSSDVSGRAIDFLYHASYIDEEGLDLLEARKDRVSWRQASTGSYTLHGRAPWGYAPSARKPTGYARELEACVSEFRAMRSRGIRVWPGGDYGLRGVRTEPTRAI